MKKHTYKHSSLILYFFYYLYVEDKTIELKKEIDKLEISRATAYNIINEIELFISEFQIYNIELVKSNGLIKIKKIGGALKV